jgi:predicted SprT family Zn-dependent metalloprotease
LLDIVAHELCHAAAVERHGFRVAWHGEEFQAIAKEALDAAARLGYKVTSDIYIEGLDT